jgi:hypothetical protein
MLGGTAQSAFGTTRFTLLALKILLKHGGCAQKNSRNSGYLATNRIFIGDLCYGL